MGFHGRGWPKYDGSTHFQTGIYADVRKTHNQEVLRASGPLAELHEFSIMWHPTKVTWFMNGQVVRKVTTPEVIPSLPMRLRLHSRSGLCDELPHGESFTSRFASFEYVPLSPAELVAPAVEVEE